VASNLPPGVLERDIDRLFDELTCTCGHEWCPECAELDSNGDPPPSGEVSPSQYSDR
jgi:hypothetical protein